MLLKNLPSLLNHMDSNIKLAALSYHPQGNGEAERAVRTVKSLLKDRSEPQLALLSYRSTPLPFCDYSPAQLLMGRRLCSSIPTLAQALAPNWPDLNKFREVDERYKQKLK